MASKEFSAERAAPVVLECTCNHEFQDRKYGKARRLHTIRPGQSERGVAVCTVCGRQKLL